MPTFDEMKNTLYEFCNAENSDKDAIWGDGTIGDGDSCRLYGKSDGIRCPLSEWSDRNRDKLVNDCVFTSPEYNSNALRAAYDIMIKFKAENPEWKRSNFGTTAEELEHDGTYQQWAPGGGVD
ncbi:MAG: hypothetical protein GOV02_01630 [Candidatus Aenigmarchaeota archaeon]|nr:hypothetical protein [Candidatus Aenigmarchaeota archaeon]